MIVSKNPKIIKNVMERLQAELKDKELPEQRRVEVESLLDYLKEDLRYLGINSKEGPTMTIEKAIELLNQDLDDPGSVDFGDLRIAQRLGIEALKRIKKCRQADPQQIDNFLPGETEE
jgi:hypothetical protein